MKYFMLYLALIATIGCTSSVAQAPVSIPAAPAIVKSPEQSKVQTKDDFATQGETPLGSLDDIQRVLIISVDGLRPDLLLRAHMPRVRELCRQGSYTFWAETAPEAYTLPCHVTMLTGAPSEKHGVTWNNYIEESYPNVPTVFELAKQAGFSTAMVSGKMKFIVFLKPGTVDYSYTPPDEPVTDRDVAIQAEGILRKHQPQLMFVHLPGVDTAGHAFGWGSREQLGIIEEADQAVAQILNTVDELQLTNSTLIMLTADHGGAANGHDVNDPRSHFIPWIAAGPGVRRDFDLTLHRTLRIGIEDTHATACYLLHIDPGHASIGRSVIRGKTTSPGKANGK